MTLVEESYFTWDSSNELESSGYVKKYDSNNNLIQLDQYDLDEKINSIFLYDEFNRRKSEISLIRRSYGKPGEELKKDYVYNNSGFTVLTYQTKIIDDSYTSEKFKNGGLISVEDYFSDHPKYTTVLLYIEEITKDKSGKIFSIKKHDLKSNLIILDQYSYDVIETLISRYTLNDSQKIITHQILQKFNDDGKIIFEKTIFFENGTESNNEYKEYTYWSDDSYRQIPFCKIKNHHGEEETFQYDSRGNLFEHINNYGERIIYINSYNDFNMLESVIEILIYKDHHTLSSKKTFKYM